MMFLVFKNMETSLKIMEKKGVLQEILQNQIFSEFPIKGDYYSNMRVLLGLSSIFKLQNEDLEILV